jgi:hypothetical protein
MARLPSGYHRKRVNQNRIERVLKHPDTIQNLETKDIQANHLEAFNNALRRRMACYRRKTNTYAKEQPALQRCLDAYWVLHNFVRPHFTTRQVPAVALGVLDHPLSWDEIFRTQYIRTGYT